MSELNILQQNIDKPNTVTEEDIVVTRDNQTFTIKGRFNGEEGVFTYDADVQPNESLCEDPLCEVRPSQELLFHPQVSRDYYHLS